MQHTQTNIRRRRGGRWVAEKAESPQGLHLFFRQDVSRVLAGACCTPARATVPAQSRAPQDTPIHTHAKPPQERMKGSA
jgi:hypothetical protein